jgi:hypothetical protein
MAMGKHGIAGPHVVISKTRGQAMLGSTTGLGRDEFTDDMAGLSVDDLIARLNAEAVRNGDAPDNPNVAEAADFYRDWDALLSGPGSQAIIYQTAPMPPRMAAQYYGRSQVSRPAPVTPLFTQRDAR